MAPWWLVLEENKGSPVSAHKLDKTLTIGRDGNCDIILLGSRISRRHAVVEIAGDAYEIRDLGSSMGLIINGEPKTRTVLSPGDKIAIGSATLTVCEELPRYSPDKSEEPKSKPQSSHFDWRPFREFFDLLTKASNPRDLLRRLLQGMVEHTKAQRGVVLINEMRKDELIPVASHEMEDASEEASISRTICKMAIKANAPIFIADSFLDERCHGVKSLAVKGQSRTIFCGPLHVEGRPFGVIYVDMERSGAAMDVTIKQSLEAMTTLAAELLAAEKTRRSLVIAKDRLGVLNTLAREGERIILGDGEAGKKLREQITSAAAEDITVLITGETGTGKEMVARALHLASHRADAPFVPVNCAALPRDIIEAELFGVEKGAFTGAVESRPGRFELAAGGTLFLDEVGELPLDFQVKLLRVLQERRLTRVGASTDRPLDFRLVCATNRELEKAVQDGSFRQDFYYRINVFRIMLAPLRKQPEAIMELARYFLDTFCKRVKKQINGFTKDAEKALKSYTWPGNVRELRNAIERAVVMERGEIIGHQTLPITSDALPMHAPDADIRLDDLPMVYEEAHDIFDKVFLKRSLERNDGSARAVARETGIARNTLYRKLKKFELLNK